MNCHYLGKHVKTSSLNIKYINNSLKSTYLETVILIKDIATYIHPYKFTNIICNKTENNSSKLMIYLIQKNSKK